jgi:5-methylcytosine-specific restriction endonuclease McrA
MGYSKEKMKEYNAKRREDPENREKNRVDCAKRYEDITTHALDSLRLGEIVDKTKWTYYCNRIRHNVKNTNHPYPEEFTDDMIFEMMSKGCYYCMDIATTIDRIDSSIGHIQENCIGSCWPCNKSKGNGDHDSFLRKAYYRSQKEYFDDDVDIWSDNFHKPKYSAYRKKAIRQKVSFELTNEQWNTLVKGNCAYCLRSLPTKKYNGIDRVIPNDGYTIDNTVSCCDDCNRDKGILSVESMEIRNDRIAERIKSEDIVISECGKNVRNTGKHPATKKVCVRGRLYQSNIEASRKLGMGETYVSLCIRDGRHSDDIFIVSDEFYKEYKNTEVYITKNMFTGFEHYLSSL